MKYRHTIQIITKDIQDIEKLVDNFNNYSSIPAIEIDLALSKLRNIYDLLLMFREAPEDISVFGADSESGVEADNHEPEIRTEEVLKETPPIKVISQENVEPEAEDIWSVTDLKETEKTEPVIPPTVQMTSSDLPENVLKATPANTIPEITVAKKAEKESSLLGDKYKTEKKFINDRFGEQTVRKDLRSKLQTTPITNIAGSIGINDKFYLIRELFKGNAESFRSTMDILDHSQNFNEAFNYLIEHFDWNMESEPALQLLGLIRRKFISQGNE